LKTRFLERGANAWPITNYSSCCCSPPYAQGHQTLANVSLKRFGSFRRGDGGAAGSPARGRSLEKKTGDAVIVALKTVRGRCVAHDARARAQPSGHQFVAATRRLLRAGMAAQPVEQFRILFLDRKNHLIADEVQQRGTVDHTPVYPREWSSARRAARLGHHHGAQPPLGRHHPAAPTSK